MAFIVYHLRYCCTAVVDNLEGETRRSLQTLLSRRHSHRQAEADGEKAAFNSLARLAMSDTTSPTGRFVRSGFSIVPCLFGDDGATAVLTSLSDESLQQLLSFIAQSYEEEILNSKAAVKVSVHLTTETEGGLCPILFPKRQVEAERYSALDVTLVYLGISAQAPSGQETCKAPYGYVEVFQSMLPYNEGIEPQEKWIDDSDVIHRFILAPGKEIPAVLLRVPKKATLFCRYVSPMVTHDMPSSVEATAFPYQESGHMLVLCCMELGRRISLNHGSQALVGYGIGIVSRVLRLFGLHDTVHHHLSIYNVIRGLAMLVESLLAVDRPVLKTGASKDMDLMREYIQTLKPDVEQLSLEASTGTHGQGSILALSYLLNVLWSRLDMEPPFTSLGTPDEAFKALRDLVTLTHILDGGRHWHVGYLLPVDHSLDVLKGALIEEWQALIVSKSNEVPSVTIEDPESVWKAALLMGIREDRIILKAVTTYDKFLRAKGVTDTFDARRLACDEFRLRTLLQELDVSDASVISLRVVILAVWNDLINKLLQFCHLPRLGSATTAGERLSLSPYTFFDRIPIVFKARVMYHVKEGLVSRQVRETAWDAVVKDSVEITIDADRASGKLYSS